MNDPLRLSYNPLDGLIFFMILMFRCVGFEEERHIFVDINMEINDQT